MYWVKGTAINRSLVIWWWCVLEEEGFYSPMIGSQSLSEPMLLEFELHKCLIFFYPLGGRGWLEWARVGYFPCPGKAVSDNIPAIQALVSSEDRPCWEEPSALASYSLSSPLPTLPKPTSPHHPPHLMSTSNSPMPLPKQAIKKEKNKRFLFPSSSTVWGNFFLIFIVRISLS